MTELLDRLTRPAVTDLEVRIDGADAEISAAASCPTSMPASRWWCWRGGEALGGTLEVSGRIGGRPWRQSVPLAEAVDGDGVAKLWARRRIAEIEVADTLGTVEPREPAERDRPARPGFLAGHHARPAWSRSTARRRGREAPA